VDADRTFVGTIVSATWGCILIGVKNRVKGFGRVGL